jgi:type IV secretory pathway VirB9-like protein
MKKSFSICLTTVLSLFFASAAGLRAADSARIVHYSESDIVTIHTKVRFSTLIVLPSDEEILDFTTGDKDFWVINGVHNLCYVHPAQTRIETNLNLVTASGHIYSFLLKEISGNTNEQPDLKVFVVPKGGTNLSGIEGQVSYVRASALDAYRRDAEAARAEAAQAIHKAQSSVQKATTQFRENYPAQLHFDYTYKSKVKRPPFSVTAIYHDNKFTYIKCDAQEKPTIYEVKDGKPSLVNFDLVNGVYIIPEIMDSGYLAIGKKKASFHLRTNAPEG